MLFFYLFDEAVVAEVGVGAVGDETVLDVLVVGVVGSGYLERLVVQHARAGVDLRQRRLLPRPDHSHKRVLTLRHLVEHPRDLRNVAVVLGCPRNQSNRAEGESSMPDHQFI